VGRNVTATQRKEILLGEKAPPGSRIDPALSLENASCWRGSDPETRVSELPEAMGLRGGEQNTGGEWALPLNNKLTPDPFLNQPGGLRVGPWNSKSAQDHRGL